MKWDVFIRTEDGIKHVKSFSHQENAYAYAEELRKKKGVETLVR